MARSVSTSSSSSSCGWSNRMSTPIALAPIVSRLRSAAASTPGRAASACARVDQRLVVIDHQRAPRSSCVDRRREHGTRDVVGPLARPRRSRVGSPRLARWTTAGPAEPREQQRPERASARSAPAAASRLADVAPAAHDDVLRSAPGIRPARRPRSQSTNLRQRRWRRPASPDRKRHGRLPVIDLVEQRGRRHPHYPQPPRGAQRTNSAVLEDLIAAFAAFEADPQQRCAVLTGAARRPSPPAPTSRRWPLSPRPSSTPATPSRAGTTHFVGGTQAVDRRGGRLRARRRVRAGDDGRLHHRRRQRPSSASPRSPPGRGPGHGRQPAPDPARSARPRRWT